MTELEVSWPGAKGLTVVHPKDPAIGKTIQEIIDAFRKQFSKAQVVHVSTPVIAARFYAD